MTINEKYNILTRGKSRTINITPEAYLPTPVDKDYRRGYINRFFTQRSNDQQAPIYEVSDVEFRKLVASPMYNTTHLRWRISGPLELAVIGAGEVVDKGIRESNKISIRLASEVITKLGLYLPNLQQFYNFNKTLT